MVIPSKAEIMLSALASVPPPHFRTDENSRHLKIAKAKLISTHTIAGPFVTIQKLETLLYVKIPASHFFWCVFILVDLNLRIEKLVTTSQWLLNGNNFTIETSVNINQYEQTIFEWTEQKKLHTHTNYNANHEVNEYTPGET